MFRRWIIFGCALGAIFGTAQAGPRVHANPLSLTAQAMGCDLKTAQEVKSLNLAPSLAWVLMRLCATSDAVPSRLLEERTTRSWGEVCALHGQKWADLARDVNARRKTFGLVVEPGTHEQNQRSGSNHPERLAVAGAKP